MESSSFTLGGLWESGLAAPPEMAVEAEAKSKSTVVRLPYPGPPLIDISHPDELWTDIAAEVPLLASPHGWECEELPCFHFPDECNAGNAVQKHINAVMSFSAERWNREGRSTEIHTMTAEQRRLREEQLFIRERVGAALQAATERQQHQSQQEQINQLGLRQSRKSRHLGAKDSDGSASDESKESVHVPEPVMQEQIYRALEAAKLRREGEVEGLRTDASERLPQVESASWSMPTSVDNRRWLATVPASEVMSRAAVAATSAALDAGAMMPPLALWPGLLPHSLFHAHMAACLMGLGQPTLPAMSAQVPGHPQPPFGVMRAGAGGPRPGPTLLLPMHSKKVLASVTHVL